MCSWVHEFIGSWVLRRMDVWIHVFMGSGAIGVQAIGVLGAWTPSALGSVWLMNLYFSCSWVSMAPVLGSLLLRLL